MMNAGEGVGQRWACRAHRGEVRRGTTITSMRCMNMRTVCARTARAGQWDNTDTDVNDHIMGTKGVAHLQDHKIEFRDGKTWQHEQKEKDDMYQNEHNEFFACIRKGEPINNGEYMCKSTMMGLLRAWPRTRAVF